MTCTCSTHFCYLCSSYLLADNPYVHFNTVGTECYGRLWEGEDVGTKPKPGRVLEDLEKNILIAIGIGTWMIDQDMPISVAFVIKDG
jgi:hypothetical protein